MFPKNLIEILPLNFQSLNGNMPRLSRYYGVKINKVEALCSKYKDFHLACGQWNCPMLSLNNAVYLEAISMPEFKLCFDICMHINCM